MLSHRSCSVRAHNHVFCSDAQESTLCYFEFGLYKVGCLSVYEIDS